MKITKKADVVWNGGIKDGKGAITTGSGALKSYPYGFTSRFEGTPGPPEELLAAAHAGCFTMALSLALTTAQLPPDELATTAEVTLEKVGAGFEITAVNLTLRGARARATAAKFQELAESAKVNCPLSKVIRAPISLKAAAGVVMDEKIRQADPRALMDQTPHHDHRHAAAGRLAAGDDGGLRATKVITLDFLCGQQSQKAANLARDQRVSITIDHDTAQVMEITGLSMAARAAARDGPARKASEALRLLMPAIPGAEGLLELAHAQAGGGRHLSRRARP